MIQDIEPRHLDHAYLHRGAEDGDFVAVFRGSEVFLQADGEDKRLFTWAELKQLTGREDWKLIYLFAIDEDRFFLVQDEGIWDALMNVGRLPERTQAFRTMAPGWMGFAGITAHHLYHWYQHTRYCGCCGGLMEPHASERAMRCPDCGDVVYPRISPAVIVGVTKGDHILLTRYAGRAFTNYALIAGFTEFGETLEDTVRREVLEEVGVKVKNIRYYKNQPWAFSESLLVGFFAELDGDDTIVREETELSEALWVPRAQVPERSSDISLTAEMMEQFRLGLV